MRLEDLKPAAGATKKAKRVGRGVGADAGYPDPAYDRKTILAESEVQAFNNSIFVTLGDTYALSYKLYDFFTGEPHPIFDSNGQTTRRRRPRVVAVAATRR